MPESVSVKINDVIAVNNLFYKITYVEPLYYQFPVTTQVVQAGQTAQNVTVESLTPRANEMYIIEKVGVSGSIAVQLQYPVGKPIGTPRGTPIFIDEILASKYQPASITMFLETNQFLGLNISAPAAWNGSASVWFFGVKCDITQITETEMQASKIRGFKVIYPEQPVLLIESGPRPVIMVYDPVSQRFVPKSELSGQPQSAFTSNIGSAITSVLPVPAQSFFALTDITITPHYTYNTQTFNATGIAASPGTAIGLSGPLDLLNFTINNTTTVAVTVVLTDGSNGGILYQTSVAAGSQINVTLTQAIPVTNQVYAYASTASVVNVSITERYPSINISQVISLYDGTTQVSSLATKIGETFQKSYKTPIVFKTAVQASVNYGTADVEISGLIVV